MLPERKQLPHGVPSWVTEGAIYFVTVNCAKRETNQLCREDVAVELKGSIQLRHQKREWWVRLCVLMPDHLHLLISFSREVSMSASMANWKCFTARKLGVGWQRDFFDHRIRDLHSLEEKEHYIRLNPVRKGLCKQPCDWPYCWNSDDFA
ncbi:transposase [Coraliomargarita algicola]|uniref:Transposase n=1 Tax=Coraliomargarita algicola TaxID=3092156 RepID=A0ABZ0RLW7_9BACT|nr:transposase [Coraliomargarita sp. J2-16]WPJ95917.1 transposase [Coraliomargarita sp. J2-16]